MATKTTYTTEIRLGAKKDGSWNNLKSAAKTLDTLDKKASKLGKVMLAAGTAVTAAGAAALKSANETYKNFEQEMATVSSISQASANEYETLQQAALEAGADTVYSAQESAEALEYMALAGWDVETSTAALMPTLKLAAATQKDLGTTSDLVTDSMGALAIGVDDLTGYLDMLTSANNNSNTSAEDLMTALIKSGGAARTLGADLDDTITSLGILANNGTKAEEAGVSLNSMFTRLASNSTALKALDSIGVSLFDDSGKFIGWREALIDINEGLEGLTDEDKAQKIAKIAGTYRYSQMKYLLDSVVTNSATGVSDWDALEKRLNNSEGSLDTMYATQTDTMDAALENLSSAKEDMQIRVTDVFADEEKEFIQWLADTLPEVTDELVDFADAHRNDIADALETAEDVLAAVWNVASEAGGWLVDNGTFVMRTLEGIAGGIATIKAANTVSKVGGVIAQIAKFAAGGPVQKVITIGSLAATAIYEIGAAMENAEQKMIDANLEEHFGNLALSMDEVKQLAGQIVGEGTLTATAEMLSAVANSADALEAAADSYSDAKKDGWKIRVGLQLDEEDFENYQNDIDSYVEDAQDYVESKGYEVNVATTFLFEGTDDESIIGELDSAFSGAQTELKEQSEKLSEYLTEAMGDGILDVDENEIVQAYLEKINNITAAVSEAEAQSKFDVISAKYSGADLDTETMEALQDELSQNVEEIEQGAAEALQTTSKGIRYKENIGEYSHEEAETRIKEAQEAYNDKVAEAVQQSADYLAQTATDTYSDLASAIPDVASVYDDVIAEFTDTSNENLVNAWKNPSEMINLMTNRLLTKADQSLTEDDRKALQQYYATSKETIDQLQSVMDSYSERGQEVPEEVAKAWMQWNLIDIIANDDYETAENNLMQLLRMDDDFQKLIEDTGMELPGVYSEIGSKINTVFGKGYDVSAKIRVDYKTSASVDYSGINNALETAENYFATKGKRVDPKGLFSAEKTNAGTATYAVKDPEAAAVSAADILSNATGGIYDKPILTTFAEEGPEAAIPLDQTPRAKSLWLEAGERLGMYQPTTNNANYTIENADGASTRLAQLVTLLAGRENAGTAETRSAEQSGQWTLVYSPNVTIQGNAKQEEVQQALTVNKKQIERLMNEVIRDQKRKAFGGA